jgi:predicted RNA-binding protein with TRAM domain
MTTPFSIPHQAQEIADAISNVVNADSTPLSPSTKMVTSQGVKNYVDGAVTSLTTSNFALATLVTEADSIGNNDTDNTIPTSAAVKDYVDNKGLATGFTQLGTTSASGTATSNGFIIATGANTSTSNDVAITVVIAGITFKQGPVSGGNTVNATLTVPIASGETYNVTITSADTPRIYFKAFS